MSQLRAFAAVAQAGGFAPAAATLDLAPSSVTRAVANLETALGVRLFHRTTRKVSLTEAGEAFLARILPALGEIDAAVEATQEGRETLTGTLKIGASVSFGQAVIVPNLSAFQRQHPRLHVELALSDERMDLLAERIDLAIRHGALEDSSLIAQRLCAVAYHLVASPAYLVEAGPLAHPSEITQHRCLTFSYAAFRSHWRFTRAAETHVAEVDAPVRVSNAAALASCAKAGMGLTLLPGWLVADDIAQGRLQSLLPDWQAQGDGDHDPALWLIMPSRQFVPAKTRVFAQFLRAIMAQ